MGIPESAWAYLLLFLTVNRLLELFTKNNCKIQIKQSLELKKKSRKNVISYMSNGKPMIILLTVGLAKRISLYKMSYFTELYARSKNKINVTLYLSNYATKFNLRSVTGVDTSDFAKIDDLASLKS